MQQQKVFDNSRPLPLPDEPLTQCHGSVAPPPRPPAPSPRHGRKLKLRDYTYHSKSLSRLHEKKKRTNSSPPSPSPTRRSQFEQKGRADSAEYSPTVFDYSAPARHSLTVIDSREIESAYSSRSGSTTAATKQHIPSSLSRQQKRLTIAIPSRNIPRRPEQVKRKEKTAKRKPSPPLRPPPPRCIPSRAGGQCAGSKTHSGYSQPRDQTDGAPEVEESRDHPSSDEWTQDNIYTLPSTVPIRNSVMTNGSAFHYNNSYAALTDVTKMEASVYQQTTHTAGGQEQNSGSTVTNGHSPLHPSDVYMALTVDKMETDPVYTDLQGFSSTSQATEFTTS